MLVHQLLPCNITLKEDILWDSNMNKWNVMEIESTFDKIHSVPQLVSVCLCACMSVCVCACVCVCVCVCVERKEEI